MKTGRVICIILSLPFLAPIFIVVAVLTLIDGVVSLVFCREWRPFEDWNLPKENPPRRTLW